MRVIIYASLLLALTACVAPGQAAPEPDVPPEAPAPPPAQPGAAPGFDSGLLLSAWNAQERRHEIRRVDSASGQDAPGYAPIVLGDYRLYDTPYAFSRDGQQLAVAAGHGEVCEPYAGGTRCMTSADILHLIDLSGWREVKATLSGKGWTGPLAFSPDGARLALVYNERGSSRLWLFDADSGKTLAQGALTFAPTLLAYTQDGTGLVTYGTPPGAKPGMTEPGPPRALLIDVATLEVEWEQTLEGVISGDWCLENCEATHGAQVFTFWTPAVVLSPDGRQLYIVHADADRLTTVNFEARSVRTVEIDAAQTWFERLLALTADTAQAKGPVEGASKAAVLAPDGKRLYVVGRSVDSPRDANGAWEFREDFLGLQVIDVDNGRQVAHQEGRAAGIKISPDGATLMLAGWGETAPWTDVLDAATLRRVRRLTGWETAALRQLNGRPVVLASQPGEKATQLVLLDGESFEVIQAWSVQGFGRWVTGP